MLIDDRSLHATCWRVAAQVQDEIISSEETYVKELRTLVMVFLRPLEKWAAEGMNGLSIPGGEYVLPEYQGRLYGLRYRC